MPTIHSADRAWPRPDRWPPCDQHDVHVWRASLRSMPGAAHYHQYLSAAERSRAGRFHFSDDRQRFVVVRGLLRAILGRYAGVEPSSFVFGHGPAGKPAIDDPVGARALTFNVSHSADLALIAVGFERPIGVDVECRRNIDVLEVSRRFFSQAEIDLIESVSGAERENRFFSCWTRREAVVKACGVGLAALGRIDRHVAGDRQLTTVNDPAGQVSEWTVLDLDPGVGYAGALAAAGREWTLRCWEAEAVE